MGSYLRLAELIESHRGEPLEDPDALRNAASSALREADRNALYALAARCAKQDGLCFVHLADDGPPVYALLTVERYHQLTGRVFGTSAEIPVDDPEWQHDHVTPEMLDHLPTRSERRADELLKHDWGDAWDHLPPAPPFRTKSGRLLTDADFEALADEAERGYEIETFESRGGSLGWVTSTRPSTDVGRLANNRRGGRTMITYDGITYRIKHERLLTGTFIGARPVYSPKGGRTVVEIIQPTDHPDDDPVVIASGEARCSARDNFNRRMGRTIALGRALKAYHAIPPMP